MLLNVCVARTPDNHSGTLSVESHSHTHTFDQCFPTPHTHAHTHTHACTYTHACSFDFIHFQFHAIKFLLDCLIVDAAVFL